MQQEIIGSLILTESLCPSVRFHNGEEERGISKMISFVGKNNNTYSIENGLKWKHDVIFDLNFAQKTLFTLKISHTIRVSKEMSRHLLR